MASSDEDKFEYTCTLSPEALEVAKSELNEDPETRLLELKALRDRIKQYPGLRPRLDPQFLIRFLRARKFDQEKAFELYLNYYRMRKEDPDIYTALKPSSVAHVYESEIAFPFKHRDKQGRKIYYVTPARMDTSRYTAAEMFKAEFLDLNKMVEDEENQVRGFVLMMDYKDFGMSHLLQLNIDFGKRMAKMWQDHFPARLKNILILNEPTVMDVVLGLFTQFVKTKIIGRIVRIGTDWEKLHQHVDPAHLPPKYGGTMKEPVDQKDWVEMMMKCDAEMEAESKYGFVDHTIGQESSKNQEDAITNMAGTFKKLAT